MAGNRYSRLLSTRHKWKSTLRQCVRTKTVDEYDVTMPAPRVRVTSHIYCGDVIILSQRRPCLITKLKWTIDDCFSRCMCSWYKIAHKNKMMYVLTWTTTFWHSWGDTTIFIHDENHSRIASLGLKSLFKLTHTLFDMCSLADNGISTYNVAWLCFWLKEYQFIEADWSLNTLKPCRIVKWHIPYSNRAFCSQQNDRFLNLPLHSVTQTIKNRYKAVQTTRYDIELYSGCSKKMIWDWGERWSYYNDTVM